jgi:hypothetical protein
MDRAVIRIQPTIPASTITSTSASPHVSLASLFLGIWLVGVALRLSLLAWQGVIMRRMVRQARPSHPPEVIEEAERVAALIGLHRIPRLLLSDTVSGPFLIGMIHPVVLLPEKALADLSVSDLQMALAHEFVHVRRGDLWMGVIPVLASTLLFVKLLAKKTGVLLDARSGTEDDKVIVYCSARPLKEVMTNLAILFNDLWIDMCRPPWYNMTSGCFLPSVEDRLLL